MFRKYSGLFSDMLIHIEFKLCKEYDGYCLIDLQGANLGGIEGDRFQSASDVAERLDVYITDYFLNDIADEFEDYGLLNEDSLFRQRPDHSLPSTCEDWVEFWMTNKTNTKMIEFVESHKFEFDVMDMLANHIDEVDLEAILSYEV